VLPYLFLLPLPPDNERKGSSFKTAHMLTVNRFIANDKKSSSEAETILGT
jgi:hypothetical protein